MPLITMSPFRIAAAAPVIYTINPMGTAFTQGFNQWGYINDSSTNNIFVGTILPSNSINLDGGNARTISRITWFSSGDFSMDIYQDGFGALPQSYFTSVTFEGAGTFTSASANYSPTNSIGFGGPQFTHWDWGTALPSGGWDTQPSRTVTFVI